MKLDQKLARLAQLIDNITDPSFLNQAGARDEAKEIVSELQRTFKGGRKLYWDPEDPEAAIDSPLDWFCEHWPTDEKNPTTEMTFDVAFEGRQETYVFTEDFTKDEDDDNRITITFKDTL